MGFLVNLTLALCEGDVGLKNKRAGVRVKPELRPYCANLAARVRGAVLVVEDVLHE